MGILTTINIDNSLTSGTLTSTQLTTLRESKTNYIIYGTELYKLVDNNSDNDILKYICVNAENSLLKPKVITVTISTLAWVYEEIEVGSGTGNVDLTGYATEEYVTTSIFSKAEQTSLDAIINNETQIDGVTEYGIHYFRAGNATMPDVTMDRQGGIAIGDGAGAKEFAVAIGKDAKAFTNASYYDPVAIGYNSGASRILSGTVAIGANAQVSSNHAIQLGSGTNNVYKSLQIHNDNIYNSNTHTLTVQNIELNGTDINTTISDKINNTIYFDGDNLLLNTVTVPELEDVDGSTAQVLDTEGNPYSIAIKPYSMYKIEFIVEGTTYTAQAMCLSGTDYGVEGVNIMSPGDIILSDGSILWMTITSSTVAEEPATAITTRSDRMGEQFNLTPEVQIISIREKQSLIVSKTSELINDSGYLTAADLKETTVSVGETETTMEEIATMATNSIQVDDAATTDDIDELFA